jgi:hypothetical protein
MGRTLADDLASDARRIVEDTTEFGRAFTYTPPLAGVPRTVTGIWAEGKPYEDKKNGLEIVHPATFLVDSEETFAREGLMTVGGLVWVVSEAGHGVNGLRTISFERRTRVRTGTDGKKFGN